MYFELKKELENSPILLLDEYFNNGGASFNSSVQLNSLRLLNGEIPSWPLQEEDCCEMNFNVFASQQQYR